MRSAHKGTILLAAFAALGLSACWTSNRPAPTVKYNQLEGARSTGALTVRSGDTVGNVAERYRLDVRDIMVVNNLQPPYALQPGQRLMLPPPRTYKVREGDTIYGVSRLFSVSTTQIARLNTLASPFVLQPGTEIRLPTVTERPVLPPITPEYTPDYGSSVASEAVSLPQPVAPGGTSAIEREELAPPQVMGTAIPAPAPQMASVSLSSRIPDATPPRSGAKFMKPVQGQTLSTYGSKADGLHNDGINIKAPHGTPIRAAENGVVVYADNMKGYGKMILIRHADKWITAYAHMDSFHVERGATVSRGQTIGTVGTTGSVREPQLHFEIRRGTDALNPEKYI